MEVLQLPRAGWIVWVQQRGNRLRSRKHFMEQPESLSVQYGVYEGHARSIAAGLVEASHEAQANWVSAGQKHNWNRRGRLFCRNRCGSIPDYDSRAPLNEFSHQTWQAFIIAAGKVVFHRDVLTLDITSLFET